MGTLVDRSAPKGLVVYAGAGKKGQKKKKKAGGGIVLAPGIIAETFNMVQLWTKGGKTVAEQGAMLIIRKSSKREPAKCSTV